MAYVVCTGSDCPLCAPFNEQDAKEHDALYGEDARR